MLTHKTPKNETCTYSYDLRDRQILADWNTTTPDTSTDYYANGQPKKIDNGGSKIETTYDLANRMLTEKQTLTGPPARTVTYSHDADGLRAGMIAPSARVVELDWTARAQLAAVTADGPPPFANYVYDKAGRLTDIIHENGITEKFINNANQYTSVTGLSAISHDANGNLLGQNGVTYIWDSENRLLSVTPNMPTLGDQALTYAYDGLHRRVSRSLREWTVAGWSTVQTLHFIYDGWNVIEEYDISVATPTLARTRTWGSDLSGSLQGAGGVGGLLMVEEISGSSSTTAYHFHYDGNGNVTEITDASGTNVARYRYDAFGNTLQASGTYAATNRYRFSTKPLDHEVTGAPLYYYGYRYYNPATGRWPSRDPIEEEGGINLYGFVKNDGVNGTDSLGLQTIPSENPFDGGLSQDETHTTEATAETKCCKCKFSSKITFTPINGRIFAPSLFYTKEVVDGGSECSAEVGQPLGPNSPTPTKLKFNFGGEKPTDWDWISSGGNSGGNGITVGDIFTKPGYTKTNKIDIDLSERVFCKDSKTGEESEGVMHTVYSWP